MQGDEIGEPGATDSDKNNLLRETGSIRETAVKEKRYPNLIDCLQL